MKEIYGLIINLLTTDNVFMHLFSRTLLQSPHSPLSCQISSLQFRKIKKKQLLGNGEEKKKGRTDLHGRIRL